MGGEYLLIQTMDWFINVLIPTFFQKLDSWYLKSPLTGFGVSVLGIIGASFIIWFFYRRILH